MVYVCQRQYLNCMWALCRRCRFIVDNGMAQDLTIVARAQPNRSFVNYIQQMHTFMRSTHCITMLTLEFICFQLGTVLHCAFKLLEAPLSRIIVRKFLSDYFFFLFRSLFLVILFLIFSYDDSVRQFFSIWVFTLFLSHSPSKCRNECVEWMNEIMWKTKNASKNKHIGNEEQRYRLKHGFKMLQNESLVDDRNDLGYV